MNRDLFAADRAAPRSSAQGDSADHSVFAELPKEHGTPEKVAMHIASLDTLAAREAFWLTLPQRWQGPFIGHFVELAIAARIVDMPEKIQRQNAIASVPDLWRENVKWQVLRLWRRRAGEDVGEATHYRENAAT